MKRLAVLLFAMCAGGTQVPAQSQTQGMALPPINVALRAPHASLRPSERLYKVMGKHQNGRSGVVCGKRTIRGETIGPVPGRIAGCGIESAVKITSVAGITLSQASVMDCETAQALHRWVDKSAIPAFRRKGGGLVSLRVAAHYACRTRNHQPGARISEHGKGKAIDISGFVLKDGTVVTVSEGWTKRGQRKAMRKVHAGACGPFGTVLGPEADRFHQDHFHFDTARHRGGPYCR